MTLPPHRLAPDGPQTPHTGARPPSARPAPIAPPRPSRAAGRRVCAVELSHRLDADLRVDVFSSGIGQAVAVRVTHLPTGLVATAAGRSILRTGNRARVHMVNVLAHRELIPNPAWDADELRILQEPVTWGGGAV